VARSAFGCKNEIHGGQWSGAENDRCGLIC
jgi:hypothetical protein